MTGRGRTDAAHLGGRHGGHQRATPFSFGEWERVLVVGLAPLREGYGWSQEELAARSGLHRTTIVRLEHPPTRPRRVSLTTLDTLARAFGYGNRNDLWLALLDGVSASSTMPLVVGEGLRRMVAAFMALAPHQQRFLEGVILSWAARHEAAAVDALTSLDVDALPMPE